MAIVPYFLKRPITLRSPMPPASASPTESTESLRAAAVGLVGSEVPAQVMTL